MSEPTRGTQIIYVPTHADGDIEHADCETGFVTSVPGPSRVMFCRFWSKADPAELRTKGASELTPVALLVIKDTVPQEQVDAALREIEAGR